MPDESQFTAPHSECADPHLWSAPDDESSEVEVADFLASLTRLLKPRIVVETGTFTGRSTESFARAARENGRGHVFGVELDPENAREATRRLELGGLDEWATVVSASSLEWTPPGAIDLLFLDAGAGWHRAEEFRHFHPYLHPGTVVCVHDTARKNRLPRLAFEALARQGLLRPVWLRCPRGLLIAQPAWPNPARKAAGAPWLIAYRAYTGARAQAARARTGFGGGRMAAPGSVRAPHDQKLDAGQEGHAGREPT